MREVRSEVHEAWELLHGRRGALLVVTCEHTTSRLPRPWTWGEDRWIATTHWARDGGAAELAAGLAGIFGAPALFTRVTRLLVDADRAPEAEDLIRTEAGGRPIALGAVDATERARRVAAFHAPWHEAVDRIVAGCPGAAVIAVHTFTPVWEGQPRSVEIGVLCDRDEIPAGRALDGLRARGWEARLDEPRSGKGGGMWSAASVAARHRRVALQIEVREDIATDPARRELLLGDLAGALREALEVAPG
jgi:predicted N-formylglutamate amidohydrolase